MMDSAKASTWSLRDWTFPEEDRALFTTTPWKPGEFRWFRSRNVVPIEQWRRQQATSSPAHRAALRLSAATRA
jgi:hypothetical protein